MLMFVVAEKDTSSENVRGSHSVLPSISSPGNSSQQQLGGRQEFAGSFGTSAIYPQGGGGQVRHSRTSAIYLHPRQCMLASPAPRLLDHEIPRPRIALTPPGCSADPTPTSSCVTHLTGAATGYHIGDRCSRCPRRSSSSPHDHQHDHDHDGHHDRELLQRAAAHPDMVRADRSQSRTGSTTVTSAVAGYPQVSAGAGRDLDRRPAFQVVHAERPEETINTEVTAGSRLSRTSPRRKGRRVTHLGWPCRHGTECRRGRH